MPRFRYVGTATLRLDRGDVQPGEIIDASGPPSKNFEPVSDPAPEPVAEPVRRRNREVAPSLEREEGISGE